ncbi:MAG: tetratricopeptide repeat protein, partial [Deltaproteobacteria bacterium]|nr:tetratricopeptide repeat protein [Deltaproteobacteria bacterium]
METPENKNLSQQNMTFLVVEHDLELRKREVQILRDYGYTDILQASDGTDAWALFKNYKVDFVVSAWNLPEMSGLVLLKIIRADSNNSSIPILLVVDSVTKVQVIEAGEAGVSDLVILPFTPGVFKEKIDNVIKIDLDPNYLEAEKSYNHGLDLMKEGRFQEALISFKRILTVFENAEIYYNMGYINTAQGNYDEAIICFRKATQINNAFAKAYRKLGEVYIKLGQNKEAEINLQKAADIYMDKHMDKNAEQILHQVVKLNPNTINVYNSLGILYRRQGRFGLALSQYEKALKVDPEDEHICYNMSRVYLLMKKFPEAAEMLKMALKFAPEFSEAQD